MTAPGIPSLSQDLANLAARLLAEGVAKHDQAEIRRAVSTAYYAVFHRLCELCADALANAKAPNAYVAIYRLLDHGPVKNTLKEIKNSDKDLARDLSATIGQFQELQDARFWADYDPSPGRAADEGSSFPPEKAKELIEFSRSAVAALTALSREKQLSLAVQIIKARGKPR